MHQTNCSPLRLLSWGPFRRISLLSLLSIVGLAPAAQLAQPKTDLSQLERETRANRELRETAEILIESHRLFHRYLAGGMTNPQGRMRTLLEELTEVRTQLDGIDPDRESDRERHSLLLGTEEELASEAAEILEWVGREDRHHRGLREHLDHRSAAYRFQREKYPNVRLVLDVKSWVERADRILEDPDRSPGNEPRSPRVIVLHKKDGSVLRIRSMMEFADKVHFTTLDGKRHVLPQSEIEKISEETPR